MADELNLRPPIAVRMAGSTIPSDFNNTRPWYDHAWMVLALLSIPLLIQVTPWWQPTDDATGYLSLARSIAGGGPLRMLGSKVLHYAIGYPLLITPAYFIGTWPLMPVIAVNFLFAMLTAVGVYLWSRRYVGSSAFFLTALTLWNASYWDLYRQPLSETAFLAALIWGALACRKLLETQGTRQIIVMTFLAAVSMIAVSTIRQVGIFLAAGYGVAAIIQAFRRESSWLRAVLTTLGVGVPASVLLVALLLLYRSMAQGETNAHTYLDQLIDPEMTLTQQLAESVRLRTAEVGRQLLPGFFKAYGKFGQWLNVNTILYVVLSAFVAYGWWKLARRDRDVLMLTAPFYLAIYLLWPFDQGTRFMTPMLPVLWLSVWQLVVMCVRVPNKVLSWLMTAHLAQAVVYLGVYLVAAQKCHSDLNSLRELVTAIDVNPSAVCSLGIPRQTHLLANLLLDRQLTLVKAGESVPEGTKWVITERTDSPVSGFAIERQAGRIALQVRCESPEVNALKNLENRVPIAHNHGKH